MRTNYKVNYLLCRGKADMHSFILSYTFASITAFFALSLHFLLVPILDNTLILFFIAVILSNWYGGFKAGLFTITLCSFFIYYFILNPFNFTNLPSVDNLLQIFIFTFISLLITLAFEKIRHSDELTKYKKREKSYIKTLNLIQNENLNLKEEVRMRDDFLSIASHELKTPLTSMLLQLQTALHNIKNVSLANFSVESLLKLLENAEAQTSRLSKMITDLLNTSLITTGRFNLEKEDANLYEITKEVLERFSEKLKKEDYKISLKFEEDVRGEWDKLRIEQIITNLLTNAIKYGENKPIEIKITKDDNSGKLTIKDHGIGIPKDKQQFVFTKFKRATSDPQYEGLGIGLYITSQIVKAHRGKISLESKENKGSTFTIELPLKKN